MKILIISVAFSLIQLGCARRMPDSKGNDTEAQSSRIIRDVYRFFEMWEMWGHLTYFSLSLRYFGISHRPSVKNSCVVRRRPLSESCMLEENIKKIKIVTFSICSASYIRELQFLL